LGRKLEGKKEIDSAPENTNEGGESGRRGKRKVVAQVVEKRGGKMESKSD